MIDISDYSNDIIAIVGFGKEGRSTYKFIRNILPQTDIIIHDQLTKEQLNIDDTDVSRDTNTRFMLGNSFLSELESASIVFLSPGIAVSHSKIQAVIKKGVIITSQSDYFLSRYRSQTIGITGTKGKSTTTRLLSHLLRNNGVEALVCGNIGVPPLEIYHSIDEHSLVAMELSSHQLSVSTHSPYISIVLDIAQDHLDYYLSQNEYVSAKSRIVKFTQIDDFLIIGSHNKHLELFKKNHSGTTLLWDLESCAGVEACIIDDAYSVEYEGFSISIPMTSSNLIGKHNDNNILAALLAISAHGKRMHGLEEALSTFKPLEHRVEELGVVRGIEFVNNASGTTPEATIAAIKAYSPRVSTIIVGGQDRNQDVGLLVHEMIHSNIDAVITLPDTGKKFGQTLKEALKGTDNIAIYNVESLEEAVRIGFSKTRVGGICLFSPAFPTYSLYAGFEEAGGIFKELVQQNS